MAATNTAGLLPKADPAVAAQLLVPLLDDLNTVSIDLLQYGETYYLRDDAAERSLAANLSCALDVDAYADDHKHRPATRRTG